MSIPLQHSTEVKKGQTHNLIADRVGPEDEEHNPRRKVGENRLEGQTDGQGYRCDDCGEELGGLKPERASEDHACKGFMV